MENSTNHVKVNDIEIHRTRVSSACIRRRIVTRVPLAPSVPFVPWEVHGKHPLENCGAVTNASPPKEKTAGNKIPAAILWRLIPFCDQIVPGVNLRPWAIRFQQSAWIGVPLAASKTFPTARALVHPGINPVGRHTNTAEHAGLVPVAKRPRFGHQNKVIHEKARRECPAGLAAKSQEFKQRLEFPLNRSG